MNWEEIVDAMLEAIWKIVLVVFISLLPVLAGVFLLNPNRDEKLLFIGLLLAIAAPMIIIEVTNRYVATDAAQIDASHQATTKMTPHRPSVKQNRPPNRQSGPPVMRFTSRLTVTDQGVTLQESHGNLYAQPFAVIQSPQDTRRPIRFELLDPAGRRRISDLEHWDLLAGETTVHTRSWAQVPDKTTLLNGWELRIYTGNVLLNNEVFSGDEGGGRFRQYLSGDGELSDELVDLLGDAPVIDEGISLDELLD